MQEYALHSHICLIMIKVENIEKSYNSERVLKNISLEFKAGDFVSIMGESGSGKSTLLNIIGGFTPADSGKVYWFGKSIDDFNDKKTALLRSTKMGFVFQSYRLIPTLNIKDNILLCAALGGKIDNATIEYVNMLTKRLKLQNMLSKYPSELSGGQCQRAAIIRALAYKPSVIILDEPTGALDSHMETIVMELLTEVNRTLGTTIIQVTHSERVAAYASKTIKLCDGEISL